jgi:hypothetical protein
MHNSTQKLIQNILTDKAFIRYIVNCRDVYGMWTWGEIVEQLYKETGQTVYNGISLRGPHHDSRLLNDLIADL